MWRLVYYIIISLAGILYLPFWLMRDRRKGRGNWPLLRLGLVGQNLSALPPGGIWIHALSVGEVNSALPLARVLKKTGRPIYFSTATFAGYQLAARELDKDFHLLVRPLDVPWVVGKWLKALRPSLFVLVESDMWPAWQRAIKDARVKSALVNARISPRSLAGYLKCKPAARLLYKDFDLICVQSELDKERLAQIGIGAKALGNLKFDSLPARLTADEQQRLGEELGVRGRAIVCGSTHEGEEKACVAAWQKLDDVCLIIAPRDIRRDIAVLMPGQAVWRASQGPMPAGYNILWLDVMGKLAKVYALAELAFIGGSLVAQGGHNPLEAAMQGRPVLFGPHMEDFAQMATSLEQAGAACRVDNEAELFSVWQRLLVDRAQAQRMGASGQAFCLAHQGACGRIVDSLPLGDGQ